MKFSAASRMTAHVAQVAFAGHPEIEETVITNQLGKNGFKYHLCYVILCNYVFQGSTEVL